MEKQHSQLNFSKVLKEKTLTVSFLNIFLYNLLNSHPQTFKT